MLATGQSLALTYEALKSHGTPKQTHLLSIIGAQTGVNYIKDKFPEDTHLWIAAIDETLNDKGYIVPGLGDAGDLAFGSKLKN
jgi:uracil phosphoribosyltransferase